MTRNPAGPRCEVCTARLDPDTTPANRPPRCREHTAQAALFPLAALPGRRRRGRDLCPAGDRHHTTTGRPVARAVRPRKD